MRLVGNPYYSECQASGRTPEAWFVSGGTPCDAVTIGGALCTASRDQGRLLGEMGCGDVLLDRVVEFFGHVGVPQESSALTLVTYAVPHTAHGKTPKNRVCPEDRSISGTERRGHRSTAADIAAELGGPGAPLPRLRLP